MHTASLLGGLLSALLATGGGGVAAAPEAGSSAVVPGEVAGGTEEVGTEPAAGDPAPPQLVVRDEVTVTATGLPTRLADTPAPVTVLGADELRAAPAATLDDVLRQVPGFTLFRRSGSRTANPTSQGPSLRGLGGSAASRALVLADGVPLADPFGGWVHWGRLPRLALERVEVLRGGASGLYGTGALAGVVQLLRRPAGEEALLAEVAAGEQDTANVTLFGASRRGGWDLSAAAEAFTSDGYVPVAAAERGPVDRAAGSVHRSGELTVGRAGEGGGRSFLRVARFVEERENGTALQDNATDLSEVVAGTDGRLLGGEVSGRLWWTDVGYEQAFTAVAADRASERLTRLQEVPSQALGSSGRWSRGFGAHTLLGGVEGRRTRGDSRERVLFDGGERHEVNGGEQEALGLWVEDVAALAPSWSLALAARYDRWRNEPRPGSAAAAEGTREASARSPRLALRWQATPTWALTAAAYRSFRAPTLNELYRGFRVGDVTTDPNPALGPERLAGGELGAAWQGQAGWQVRGTLFWMELEDAITNVTLSSGPDGIQRRRENVGRTRSRGGELELEGELGRGLALTGGLQLVAAEIVRFAADPQLVGKRVAQVPELQASLGFTWRGTAGEATLLARYAGGAWDDDRNELALGDQFVVDAQVVRPFAAATEFFLAVENLFDDEYAVGRTPVTTVGSPRLLRLGVRYRGASRRASPRVRCPPNRGLVCRPVSATVPEGGCQGPATRLASLLS